MNPLRKKMTDELVRRNYSEGTVHAYLPSVQEFAKYFHCPPDPRQPRAAADEECGAGVANEIGHFDGRPLHWGRSDAPRTSLAGSA